MSFIEDSTPQKDYPKLGDDLMQFFAYEHLDAGQKRIAKGFHDFAEQMVRHLPKCPERTVALRKLLESKDAAVRATVWKPAS
jgi:hypothetical protein